MKESKMEPQMNTDERLRIRNCEHENAKERNIQGLQKDRQSWWSGGSSNLYILRSAARHLIRVHPRVSAVAIVFVLDRGFNYRAGSP
jgi:hypothetical protein